MAIEQINLFSIIITFLATIFGWLFTHRTQLKILDKQLQNEISISKLKEKMETSDLTV
ncbi:MAG: hypothetical protein HY864_01710 [Chloroflexi bacterium]|nr:hypothetical protein [Chloroflexota bacterium]